MGKSEKPGPSIATRTGDSGETSLLYGKRVSKSHPQVEACGAVDELSAALGMAKAHCPSEKNRLQYEEIQKDLIALMGEISTPAEDLDRYNQSTFAKIDDGTLARIDREVAKAEGGGREFTGWAYPGENLHSAALEVARTTARRAERRLVAVRESGFPLRPLLLQYLNRVSDLLWLLAREAEEEF